MKRHGRRKKSSEVPRPGEAPPQFIAQVDGATSSGSATTPALPKQITPPPAEAAAVIPPPHALNQLPTISDNTVLGRVLKRDWLPEFIN